MGALFGLLASLAITSMEFFSRRITNEVGPIVAAAAASLIAAIVTFGVAAIDGGDLIGRDLLLGAGSGIGFGLGLSTYLHGLRISSSAVIGPTVASLSALIPFGYAAVTGDAPPALGYLGAALAVAGLILVTVGGSEASNVRGGLPVGIVSGMGYGVGTLLLINVSEDSGSWSIASQRVAAFAAIATFALIRRRPVFPPVRFARHATAAGVIAAMSSVFLLAGLAINPAATSVTATVYPATSVAAGRAFFGDAVTRLQVGGLVVVILGTIAIVLA
ncbi:MAG: EamA family transporter [Actinomycetota bacterium]